MCREERIIKVVSTGKIRGIKYWIVEQGLYNSIQDKWGIWYCAYIKPPRSWRKLDVEELNSYPHGGITWIGELPSTGCYVWGWDYNHCTDISWNSNNFLETKLQVLGREKAINIITRDIVDFIGGVFDEICNENII